MRNLLLVSVFFLFCSGCIPLSNSIKDAPQTLSSIAELQLIAEYLAEEITAKSLASPTLVEDQTSCVFVERGYLRFNELLNIYLAESLENRFLAVNSSSGRVFSLAASNQQGQCATINTSLLAYPGGTTGYGYEITLTTSVLKNNQRLLTISTPYLLDSPVLIRLAETISNGKTFIELRQIEN